MFSLSYFSITAHSLVADGRNGLGNRPPRDIGSSASRLMQLMDGSITRRSSRKINGTSSDSGSTLGRPTRERTRRWEPA